ncbi:MAG: transposase [Firmicutes bacterium]|nr:transposase [Bacillota bacterium]
MLKALTSRLEIVRIAILKSKIRMEEKLPKRKYNRLFDYDYSQEGAYFVTICTLGKKHLLGEVITNVGAAFCRPHIKLSKTGEIVKREIQKLSSVYDEIKVDKYVIMPNHIHLLISNREMWCGRQNAAPTLSRIIGQFKRVVAMKSEKQIWQKSFHDHIVRDEKDYFKIWEYIDTNCDKWNEDVYNNL